MNAKQSPPRYDYVADFLSPVESDSLFSDLKSLHGYILETGACNLLPTHSTVMYGPRQAYMDCVPKPYRAVSSGEAPDFLAGLKQRIEEKYLCCFNSVQINQHYDMQIKVNGAVTTFIAKVRPDGDSWDLRCIDPLVGEFRLRDGDILYFWSEQGRKWIAATEMDLIEMAVAELEKRKGTSACE